MYRVLIAEDEHLERRAIKFYLDKFYSDKLEIAAEVANGEEALFKALENNVDLVLMDIKMPKINGLQAAEKLKKERPEIEIIILTAHSEFDYAQKSIQIGVVDYLVKPYVEKDFCRVIDKGIAKIKKREEGKIKQKELSRRLKEITPIIEKEVILELIYNTKDSIKKFEEYKEMLDIEGNEFMFILFNKKFKEKFPEDFFFKAKEKIDNFSMGVIAYNGFKNMIFLAVGNNLKDINQKKLNKSLEDLKKEFASEYGKELYYNKSEISSDLKQLNDLYNQSREAFLSGELKIENYPYKREKNIITKIIEKDYEPAKAAFSELFDFLINENNCNSNEIKAYLRRFLIFLNRRLLEYYNKDESILNISKLEEEIRMINDLEKLRNYFNNLLENIIKNLSSKETDQKVEVIERVKEYIRENYSEDISLESVAEYISFSKYYLSKLFKEVEGINYKDYLIKIRMEKAKEMLKEGGKIKVIAREVGYSDRNYFSRAFKKYTGISPGRFR